VKIFNLILAVSAIHFSCNSGHILSAEKMDNNMFVEFSTFTFRHKGEKITQLDAIIRDSSKRMIEAWHISNKCSCIGKTYYTPYLRHYKLTTETNYNSPLNEQDRFLIKKLSQLKEIENFCSRSLLDSAKGFIPEPVK
jgi:hypothetical protein